MQESQSIFDRQLKKNFLYNAVFQLVIFLYPLLLSPYLSRILGPVGVGQYNYTFTIASYFGMVCLLGIGTYGNRECAVCRSDKRQLSKTFWSIYAVQLIASVVALASFSVYFLAVSGPYRALFAIQYILVISSVLDITWFFYGLEQFQNVVLRNVVLRICVMASVFLFVKAPEDVWKYCMCTAVAYAVANLSMWPYAARYIEKVKIEPLDIIKHIKPALYLFIPVLGINIYAGVDKLMLESMVGVESVGFYSNAEGLCKFPYGIVTALSTVILPRISHLSSTHRIEKGNKIYQQAFEKTIQVTMFLAFPICIGIAAIAPEMVPWYYTTRFMPCIRLIQQLSVLVLFAAWTNAIQSHYIVPLNMDRVLIRSSMIALFLNIGVNYVLIRKYGVYGAAYGTVITEIVVLIYKTWSVRSFVDCWSAIKKVIPYVLASAVMFVAVRWVGERLQATTVKTTIIEVASGMLCYACICGIWFGLCKIWARIKNK